MEREKGSNRKAFDVKSEESSEGEEGGRDSHVADFDF